MEALTQTFDFLLDLIVKYGPTILYCFVIIIIGLILSSICSKFIRKSLKRTKKLKNDSTISIIINITKVIIFTVVGLTLLNKFHFPITSFVAIFSASGIAFSLAAKDTLSNLAKGVQIFFVKPFGHGDYIEIGDISGVVKNVEVFYTRILSDDNKDILVPNSEVADKKIINYSTEPIRRLDLNVSVPYKNADNAIDILKGIIESSNLVLKTPDYTLSIVDYKNNEVSLGIYVYVNRENYSELKQYISQQMYKSFLDKNLFDGD